MKRISIALLMLSFFMTGCQSGSDTIDVDSAWARPANHGDNTAIYMILTNRGEADTLLSAATDVTEETQIHSTLINDEGQARMEMHPSLEIPGGETLVFEQGGLHIMVLGVNTDLSPGDTISLTLTFENYGEVTLEVPVESN